MLYQVEPRNVRLLIAEFVGYAMASVIVICILHPGPHVAASHWALCLIALYKYFRRV